MLQSGRSGLAVVFRSANLTIYRVPSPQPIVTGPGHPVVTALTESTVVLKLSRPGNYHLGIRFSPYLRTPNGCVTEASDGMTVLTAPTAGKVNVAFSMSAKGALDALTGSKTTCPTPG